MSDFLVEQQGAVLRVTINHPERGNGNLHATINASIEARMKK